VLVSFTSIRFRPPPSVVREFHGARPSTRTLTVSRCAFLKLRKGALALESLIERLHRIRTDAAGPGAHPQDQATAAISLDSSDLRYAVTS